MDALKRLKIELPGMKQTIFKHSSGEPELTKIDQIENALTSNDKESILYCLKALEKWFNKAAQNITRDAPYVDVSKYNEKQVLLQSMIKELEIYEFPPLVEIERTSNKMNAPLIFISHKGKDAAYGNALEKFIVGLGVKNQQLIYTSHPLHKIPLDANIYTYLRENINSQLFMIILWSDDYLDSPACLNEMGAAWVVQCDYTSLYVPTFSFGNPKYHECAVDTRKMGAVLKNDSHCKQAMIELKNKILLMFNLTIDEASFTYLLDQFMKDIEEAAKP